MKDSKIGKLFKLNDENYEYIVLYSSILPEMAHYHKCFYENEIGLLIDIKTGVICDDHLNVGYKFLICDKLYWALVSHHVTHFNDVFIQLTK